MNSADVILSVGDFVAVFNQTLEFAYPSVTIVGELANFRISKNRWVYFDLKDEFASVKCFGSVYQLPGPLEDGMLLQVRGAPRLHQQFGFSFNVISLQPVGEGTLKRAAQLLEAKLRAEGLFDPSRKRRLVYPPTKIGLIASAESAAYHDFVKVLNSRWGGLEIQLTDVQVQGEAAPGQIIEAIDFFNQQAEPPEILVITRGGGSPEDLAAFSTEQVTRAVAASRIPTLIAIGHEVDVSLAELAADQRASTPSNAAELIVPDRKQELVRLNQSNLQFNHLIKSITIQQKRNLEDLAQVFNKALSDKYDLACQKLTTQNELLTALSPKAVLKRGYAVVRASNSKVIKTVRAVYESDKISIEWHDGQATASITSKKA